MFRYPNQHLQFRRSAWGGRVVLVISVVMLACACMLLPASAESPSEEEKKIYVEARDDLRDKFKQTHGHFKVMYKKLATFQQHITNWRNATTRRTQSSSIDGVKGLITETTGEMRDTAIKTLLGEDALQLLKDFEKEVGFEFLPNGQQLDKALKAATGADDLYGYMYQLSAMERQMRQKGVFKSVQKVADMFQSAEGYIDDASKVVDFVAVFDPGNVDPNNPISRLDAIDGVLGYMQTFSEHVPGIGKVIGFYSEATKAFAKALTDLDKKLQEARMGSICGGIGGDRQKALARFLVGKRAALDCFRFFTYYEAEAALKDVQAWQHFEADAAFFYAPDGSHAFLSRSQAHKLLGAFQALRSSAYRRNQALAVPERFMDLAAFASERGRTDPSARQYVPGYDLCASRASQLQSKAFASLLKLAGETDLLDLIVNLGSDAILAVGRLPQQELIGLCLFDSDVRMTMKRLMDRYQDKQIHILQIYARDRGTPPTISGLSVSDPDHMAKRQWMRRSVSAGYVRLPVIVTQGKSVRYALSAKGFKPLRFVKAIRGDRAAMTTLYMDRVEPEPDPAKPTTKRPDPKPDEGTRPDQSSDQPSDQSSVPSSDPTSDQPAGDVPTVDDNAPTQTDASPWGAPPSDTQIPNEDKSNPWQEKTAPSDPADPFKTGSDASPKDPTDQATGQRDDATTAAQTDPTEKQKSKPEIPSVSISGSGPAIKLSFGPDGAYLGQSQSLSVAAPTFETSGASVPEAKPGEIYIGAADDTEDLLPPAKIRYVWQSSPPLSFSPAVSSDGRTKVTFSSPGPVKIWADISNGTETVKSQIVELKVMIPTFDLHFSPTKAAAAGQSVTAMLAASPDLEDRYIAVQWTDPPEANRKDEATKGRRLSFTGTVGETVPVGAKISLAATGERLASVSKGYQFATLALTIKAKRRGPPVKIWDAKTKGLIDAAPGSFYVGEAIDLSADFGTAKKPDAIKWRWQGGKGDSLSNPSGSWPTLTRSEAGAAAISLTILDRNGKEIATASKSISILQKPTKPKSSAKKQKPEKSEPEESEPEESGPAKSGPAKTGPDQTKSPDKKTDRTPKTKAGGKQASDAQQSNQQTTSPTNAPKPPIDPCAAGSNQQKAAAQMWQTALTAVSQSNYERAFAHFEASLALCSDPKRRQMVQSLRDKLLGQKPANPKPSNDQPTAPSQAIAEPEPTHPSNNCAVGSSERKAAEYMWKEGLQSVGRRDYPRAIAHLEESLALCPDAKRQRMMEQMRAKLQALMAKQKQKDQSASDKKTSACSKGSETYQKARTHWSDGLNALRLGQNQKALADFQKSVALCPDNQRQQQIATLQKKLATSQAKSPFDRAVSQSAKASQNQPQSAPDSQIQQTRQRPTGPDPFGPTGHEAEAKAGPQNQPQSKPENGTDTPQHIQSDRPASPFDSAPSMQTNRPTNGPTNRPGDIETDSNGHYEGQIAIPAKLAPGDKAITFERIGERLTCTFRISHGNVAHRFKTTIRNGRFDQTFTLNGPGGQTVSMRMVGTVTRDQITGDIGPANKRQDHFKFTARRVDADQGKAQQDGTYQVRFSYRSDVNPTITITLRGEQIQGRLTTDNYQARGQFSARLRNGQFKAAFRYSASYGYAGDVDVVGEMQQGAIAMVLTERDSGKQFRLIARKQ